MGLKASLPIFLLVLFSLMASSLGDNLTNPSRRESGAEKQLERCLVRCDMGEGECMEKCVEQFDRQISGPQEGNNNSGGRLENGWKQAACMKACQYAGSRIAIHLCQSKCRGHFR